MSLTELIVASVLFAGTATGGLHVWGQARLAARTGWLKQQQLEAVEVQLLAGQRWLAGAAHDSDLLTAKGSCRFDARAVSHAADRALPLPEGLQRHWQAQPYGAGLWLELVASPPQKGSLVGPLLRRQLLTPAGSGWCRPNLKIQR